MSAWVTTRTIATLGGYTVKKRDSFVYRYPAYESASLLLLAAFSPCALVDRAILANLLDSHRIAITVRDTGERRNFNGIQAAKPVRLLSVMHVLRVYLSSPRAGRQCYPESLYEIASGAGNI